MSERTATPPEDEHIDAEDLAMLAAGFEAAMLDASGPAEADQALFQLGWGELLAAAPVRGAATAFTALGRTGSAAGLLDDVVAGALGFDGSPAPCVVLPAPGQAAAPGTRVEDRVRVDGVLSTRVDVAVSALLAVEELGAVRFVTIDAGLVRGTPAGGIDPGHPYRRVTAEIAADTLSPVEVTGTWESAVAAARVALAHQLVSAARWMTAEACQHAVDRVQFGRPVASFQAIRHKLAESLVKIEGAASVAGAYREDSDPLLAALAKSLAGAAALTAAKHAQQVLAGVGFTTDHQFHRWLKRVLVVDTLFGSASSLPTEIGFELLARHGAPRLVEL